MPQSPQRDPSFQWIEFTDFSPGIWSNNKLSSSGTEVTSTNPTYAEATDTYRCVSLPSGGLGPLPRLQASYPLSDIPSADPGTVFKVAGFSTWGRILKAPNNGVEAHVMVYHQDAGSGPGLYDATLTWYRERLFESPSSTETIHTVTATDVGSSGPRYTYFLKTRMNPSSPDDIGTPVMVCVSSRVANNDIIISRAWPDPSNDTSNDTIVVGTAGEDVPYVVSTAHQSRVILAAFATYGHGVNAALVTNENVYWTETNDNTLVSEDPAGFVPELDQSITDMCPMSSNSLLMVKWYGGGYVLQGDLSDTTVVQLPNLPCPDGSDYVRGVNTQSGYIYSAGPGGMYLWNGGDGAKPISSQLDGNFSVGDNFISGPNGQCDRWIDRVLVPRNWMWDSISESWWRIEDPDVVDIRYWSTAAYTSIAMGAETTFTAEAPDFIHKFTYTDLAYTYSWRSQPIWVSQDRMIETREAIIAIAGVGAVTITLINENGDEMAHTFTSTGDEIRNHRSNMFLAAENLEVKIESSGLGAGPDGENIQAPVVHRLYVGVVQTRHLALDV